MIKICQIFNDFLHAFQQIEVRYFKPLVYNEKPSKQRSEGYSYS